MDLILPLGFEAEYASDMRSVKPPRIPMWNEETEYPEEACALCIQRSERMARVTVAWKDLICKLVAKSHVLKDEYDRAWLSVNHYRCMAQYERDAEAEQKIMTKRIKCMQSIKKARLLEFLAWKKHTAAFWRYYGCISKRQRPFLYAHNSIRE